MVQCPRRTPQGELANQRFRRRERIQCEPYSRPSWVSHPENPLPKHDTANTTGSSRKEDELAENGWNVEGSLLVTGLMEPPNFTYSRMTAEGGIVSFFDEFRPSRLPLLDLCCGPVSDSVFVCFNGLRALEGSRRSNPTFSYDEALDELELILS